MEDKRNPKLELARRIIEKTGTSMFLTGRAGTGKTTFLRELRDSTRKRVVVTAPTGIAAINAGGVTLHSFFQLDFGIFIPGHSHKEKFRMRQDKQKIIRGMDLLVIDEVSMVRADLLDAVDDVLRRMRDRTRPFGGVQLLLIGDLQQLPPVVRDDEQQILSKYYSSNYFFESRALKQLDYATVELDEVYRQNDPEFLDILNAIRDNRADSGVLKRLNSCVPKVFNPDRYDGYIRLTTHNRLAADINEERLRRLPSPAVSFDSHVEGTFPESLYPADRVLTLKVGAQVMFIKNDSGTPRAYYNGMIGQVVAIDPEEGIAVQPADGGEIINVDYAEWENNTFSIDEETKEIVEKKEGSFSQIPLKPAWAVTIHKSQGLTFDRAIIDASRSFAHGQAYVALSRCRNLQGLVLEKPIPPQAIINDMTVNRYMQEHSCDEIPEERLSAMERDYRISLLEQLFSFRILFGSMEGVVRMYLENFARSNPALAGAWSAAYETLKEEVNSVADKFRLQYSRLAAEGKEGDEKLQERISAASSYFLGKLQPLMKLASGSTVETTNKTVKTKLTDRLDMFKDLLTSKILLLNAFRTQRFSADVYLDLKAQAMLRNVQARIKRPSKKEATLPASKPQVSSDTEKNPKEEKVLKEVKKTKIEKKPKMEKIPSWQVSIDMLKSGKTPAEIAEIRNLATSTIYGHFKSHMTPAETLPYLNVLIRPEALAVLEKYGRGMTERTKTVAEIMEILDNVPSYDETLMYFRAHNCGYKSPEIAEEPAASYGKPEDFIE